MSWLQKLDRLLDRWCPLLVPLALLTFLKLPSFSEPYWYGDEAIYLAIGNGLRNGERLYATIIDHKTPLIYYFAMVPHQFWFRVLMFAWMGLTTVLFFKLAHRLLDKPAPAIEVKSVKTFWQSWHQYRGGWLATMIFVILTNLPLLEGNIPNGELFVMGFVMLAWWLVLPTKLFQAWLKPASEPQTEHLTSPTDQGRFFAAGLALGGAILTKVPGLFDAAALLSLPVYMAARTWTGQLKFSEPQQRWLMSLARILAVCLSGVAVMIIGSILYFAWRGSAAAYLDYGLLYNFRYAGNWTIPATQPIVILAMSLLGKAVIAGLGLLAILIWHRQLSPRIQIPLIWAWLALFASLLSNRPYPHYFLQLVPAFSLLLGYLLSGWAADRSSKTSSYRLSVAGIMAGVWIFAMAGAMWAVGSGAYPTLSYYHRFWQAMTGQITWTEYKYAFNHLISDNTAAAEIIRQSGDKRLFIWGTNPVLYAQSGTYPTGRFTVSFHIKDFSAFDESVRDVKTHQPTFIVVMKDEPMVLPELMNYLHAEYVPHGEFKHFVLWKRRNF